MKKILWFTLLILLLCFFSAYSETGHDYKAALLIEANTGKILYEYNKDKILPEASITKLMTYYTFKNFMKENSLNESTRITIERNKFNIPSDGVQIRFKVKETVSLKELLNTMLIISANDSAEEIGYIFNKGKVNIIASMNNNCRYLNMSNSHYVNVTGITETNSSRKFYNTTTAYDLSKLAIKVLKEYPEILQITSIKKYKFQNKLYYNTNPLLSNFKTVDGLKTGHTDEAGYCLVATDNVTSLIGNGKPTRFLAIILGCKSEASRKNEASELIKYGENNFVNYKALSRNQVIRIKNDYYDNDYIDAFVKNDSYLLKNKNEKVTERVFLNDKLNNSILKGENIGYILVQTDNEKIRQQLFAAKDIKIKPAIIRFFISIKIFFSNLLKDALH